MIHQLLLELLTERRGTPEQAHAHASGKLWVSEIGGCIRKAAIRSYGLLPTMGERGMLLRYENGTAFERSTVYLLQQRYGDQVQRQFPIETDAWAGRLDVLIDGAGVPLPIIMEHKATGDRWWDYNAKLPETTHVLQAAAYGLLFEQLYHVAPLVILYYRAWSHYAEFTITREEERVIAHGLLDDGARDVALDVNLPSLMAEMVAAWRMLPAQVPPRLTKLDDGCTFRGQPSCGFYPYCWPDDTLAAGITEGHP